VATVSAVGLLVLFMGFYVMEGSFDPIILFFMVPQMFYGVEFIMNVQIPDREADLSGRKTTFVVLYGRKISFIVVILAVISATVFYALMWLMRIGPAWKEMGYLTLISLIPLMIALPSVIKRPSSKKRASPFAVLNMASLFMFLIGAIILFLLI
jgi:4-hydroxybenzoate polyprenyltransferase